MEAPANSHMLGKMSISKDCPVTPSNSTPRSLWSPQRVTQDNCPKGMSLNSVPAGFRAAAASPLPAPGKSSSHEVCRNALAGV